MNKIFLILLLLVVTGLNVFCFVLGDVNFDGEVTVKDAELINKWFVEQENLTPAVKKAADVDCNGWINMYDVQYMYRYVVKDIPKLPCSSN